MDRLLIIDDDPELRGLLATYLSNEGFAVEQADNGESGLQQALSGDYAAIVLDIMLPGLNGIELLKQLRRQADTPVVMLTARGDDLERIIGLELGADDYLPKPCNPRELLARIKAVLRRSSAAAPGAGRAELLQAGELCLDSTQHQLRYGGQDLRLTNAEYKLLALLMRRVGQVVPKEELYRQALGRSCTAYDRSLDMHISNIRKKIAVHCARELLVNIRGIGYKLV